MGILGNSIAEMKAQLLLIMQTYVCILQGLCYTIYMKENLITYRTCVCNINYHVVWSVKYRKKSVPYRRRTSADTSNTRVNLIERSDAMLLAQKTSVKVDPDHGNLIGHMCYAAYKLWNVCNYERIHYQEMGLPEYPNWYYQKKAHKDSLWFKQLPSQTAQEVCKLLDKSWRSFFTLKRTKGIETPIHRTSSMTKCPLPICRTPSSMRPGPIRCASRFQNS